MYLLKLLMKGLQEKLVTNELTKRCRDRLSWILRTLSKNQWFWKPTKMNNKLAFTPPPTQSQCSHASYLSNQNSSIIHFWDTDNFIYILVTRVAIPLFNHTHPKIVQLTFSFRTQHLNFKDRVDWQLNPKFFHHNQYAKIIQSIFSVHHIIKEIQLILEWCKRPHPFFTMPTQ